MSHVQLPSISQRDGRERQVGLFVHYDEWQTRVIGTVWRRPEALVNSQPVLALTDISWFMDLQQKRSLSTSMACITSKGHANCPVLEMLPSACWNPKAKQSWPPSLTCCSTQENRPTPCTLYRQHSSSGPGVRDTDEMALPLNRIITPHSCP